MPDGSFSPAFSDAFAITDSVTEGVAIPPLSFVVGTFIGPPAGTLVSDTFSGSVVIYTVSGTVE